MAKPYEPDFEPSKLRSNARIFVNPMGDTFHSQVPDWIITKAFDEMAWYAAHHTYLLLTKRVNRMRRYINFLNDPLLLDDNIWVGTSVENRKMWARAEMLKKVNAKVRFLSIEPLLEDLGEIDLTGIHWVIVGGESGPNYRPMQLEWADSIRLQCAEQGAILVQTIGWPATGDGQGSLR